MQKLVFAAALLASTALAVNANAATVADLGVNPTSASGHFDSLPGGTGGTGSGPFRDQILFELQGGPAFLTIASATNVYPGGTSSTDFITNFTGSLFFAGADGAVGGGDDQLLIGPVTATSPCGFITNCQGFAGSTTLTMVGHYFLNLAGIGGGSSGYGGNLSVSQVPLPGALVLFGTALVGLGLLGKKKKLTPTPAA